MMGRLPRCVREYAAGSSARERSGAPAPHRDDQRVGRLNWCLPRQEKYGPRPQALSCCFYETHTGSLVRPGQDLQNYRLIST